MMTMDAAFAQFAFDRLIARRAALAGFPLGALLALSTASWAQVAAAQQAPEPATLPAVTVRGGADRPNDYRASESSALGIELPAQQVPAAVSIVTEEFLRDFNIGGLNELANYVPGVTLNDNGGETGENLLIRGFGSTTNYIDGLRTTTRYGVQRTLPDTIERIEITKGPAGAEAGVADFGGTVNIVTKKPQRARAFEFNAALGDFGYRKAGVDLTGALAAGGALQGRLIAAYEEGAEWRRGRPEHTPRYVIAPSLNWDYAPGGSLLLQYEHYYQNSPQDRGIVYLEGAWPGSNFAPRDWSFHQSTDSQKRRLNRVSLDWNQALSESWTLRGRVQRFDERRDLREFRNAESEPDNGSDADLYNDDGRSWNGNRTIAVYFADWRENYRTTNAQAELNGRLHLGATPHTLRLGVERYRFEILDGTEFARTTNDNTIDIFAPDNHQSPNNLEVVGPPYVDQGGRQQRSVYATWLAEWTPRWRTVLGVRDDRFRTDERSLLDGVVDFARINSSDALSWRVATSFDIRPDLTAFAGLSRAFQPQGGITQSGAQVDPTGGRSVEAGVKAALFGRRALWTNTVFQIEQDNIAACDTDPSLAQDDIDNCRFSVLFGSARVRGFESELQGHVTRNLQLLAGISLMNSRVTQTEQVHENTPSRLGRTFVGNRFPNTPKRQASLAATWRWAAFGLPQLKTSLGIVHVGQRWGDPGNSISLPGYTVVNAGASWQLTPATTLGLFVDNLFDRTYTTAMQASSDRADQVQVGTRRLVQASLVARF